MFRTRLQMQDFPRSLVRLRSAVRHRQRTFVLTSMAMHADKKFNPLDHMSG